MIYYSLRTKVMSFNYVRPKFETIFEDDEE